MKKKYVLYTTLALLITLGGYAILKLANHNPAPVPTPAVSDSPAPKTTASTSKKNIKKTPRYFSPVTEFKKRITKKRFGTYITPANSPVRPERFSGYHTGVDVEFTDVTKTVSVHAIANGTVLYSGTISGYGGVLLITHTIKGQPRTVVYGHLAPSSLATQGKKIKANQLIGKLGAHQSAETDGERKHLHFAILNDSRQDFRGYVSSKDQLSAWLDPLDIY